MWFDLQKSSYYDRELVEEDVFLDFSGDIEALLKEKASYEQIDEIIDYLWSIIKLGKNKFIKHCRYINQQPINNQQNPMINLFLVQYPPPPPYLLQLSQSSSQIQQFPQIPMMAPILSENFYPQQSTLITTPVKTKSNKKDKHKHHKHNKHQKEGNNTDKKSQKDKKGKKETEPKKYVDKAENDTSKYNTKYFPMDKNQSTPLFNGIISYLRTQSLDNPHLNGTIEISTNSASNDALNNNNVKYIVDYILGCNYYKSKDMLDSYLCFDFKNRLVEIEGYTIRSLNLSGSGQLRNWVIEVSDDKDEWTVIDRHSDDISLKRNNVVVRFELENKKAGFHRFVRLRQTGESWDPNGHHFTMGLKMIEFFGTLKELNK